MNEILISNSSKKTREFLKSKEVGIILINDQEIFFFIKGFEKNVFQYFYKFLSFAMKNDVKIYLNISLWNIEQCKFNYTKILMNHRGDICLNQGPS